MQLQEEQWQGNPTCFFPHKCAKVQFRGVTSSPWIRLLDCMLSRCGHESSMQSTQAAHTWLAPIREKQENNKAKVGPIGARMEAVLNLLRTASASVHGSCAW
eukprot:957026-Amphidinium_carterae.2